MEHWPREGDAEAMPRVPKVPKSREPSESRKTFAASVRRERHAQGLTLEDLGERSNLEWSYLSQVERGIRNITVDNMDAIARGLGLPLRDLL
ncbi:helix-turn-helix domain-containing protein [Deinococcus wulumuqiensis]|uniref:helix-turn-helix domain-containing protein n=2 Tax=Deinococcus wulumuqiensis TaxID=980427 RepID=UPI0027E43851|nr:helix-turn-helix transcriptional regulator [Deinococcus wulumuqiensis]